MYRKSESFSLLVEVFLQSFVFLLGQSHETAVLRGGDAFDVHRIAEVGEVFVCLTDAIVLGLVAILNVCHSPSLLSHNLEGAATLAFLVALKVHKIMFIWFWPRSCQSACFGMKYSWMTTFLLDEHVVLAVTLQVVDVCVDGGIAPVKKDLGLGQFREGLVSIAVNHAVIRVILVRTPNRIVDEVTTLFSVRPFVMRIPKYLRSPHSINLAPVAHHIGALWITENLIALAEIESSGCPMNEVIALQEIDSIIEPDSTFAHTHIRGHHQVALARVRLATHISITLSTLNQGKFFWVHHCLSLIQVMVVQPVTAQGISGKFTMVAHVTIEITIRSLLQVLCRKCHY